MIVRGLFKKLQNFIQINFSWIFPCHELSYQIVLSVLNLIKIWTKQMKMSVPLGNKNNSLARQWFELLHETKQDRENDVELLKTCSFANYFCVILHCE